MNAHVSVCVCAFNGARVLERAIESILAQTYEDFELLIVDDASTDDTLRIARSYHDQRIRVVRNPRNLGNARNRSHAISLSTTDLVKFVDQDDWLQPPCLEEHVRCMGANPTVGLTFSRSAIALEDAQHPQADFWSLWPEQVRRATSELGELNPGADVLRQFLRDRSGLNWIGGPTAVMLRRACLRRSGMFNRQLRQQLDLDLWIRMMAFCDVGYLDQELATIWVGRANETRGILADRRDWLDRLWLLEGLMQEFPDLRERYPELAAIRHAELKSVFVAAVTGRFRTTRFSDALRDLGGYVGYKLRRSGSRASLFDWLEATSSGQNTP